MISPRVTVHWPHELRLLWLRARLARVDRRSPRGGRWRELVEHGEPVG